MRLAFLLSFVLTSLAAAAQKQQLANGKQAIRRTLLCAPELEARDIAQDRLEDAVKKTNSSKTELESRKDASHEARFGVSFFKAQVQIDKGDIIADKGYKKELEKKIAELRATLKTSSEEEKEVTRAYIHSLQADLRSTKIDLRTTGKRLARNEKLLRKQRKLVEQAKKDVAKAKEDLQMDKEVEGLARKELKRAQAELKACEDELN